MKPCCEAMAQVLAEWDGPFYKPITIDRETHALRGDRLAIALYKLTASKKAIASKPRASLFLNYCPICGQDLRGE